MAREVNRLNALAVGRAIKPGYYHDGAGLYLQVSQSGTKSWIYRYTYNSRPREMGLGSVAALSLSDARVRAKHCRHQRAMGIDPLEERRASAQRQKLEDAKAITFADAATRYIATHESAWRNKKHRSQWRSTLENYAFPIIGTLSVAAVDTSVVLKIIEPMWRTKPETASRVRGRIESVLNWATARGFRQGENPARWRGHLDRLLPARSRVKTVKHHSALPFAELPVFMSQLRAREGAGARALELTILTGLRTGEVIGARWQEVDLQGKMWIVPAERMKAKREHRIPLSDYVIAMLSKLPKVDEFIFPGERSGQPISNMAMLSTLGRLSRRDLTVHGFRSTFRDWAAERTNFPNHVVEMALAHTIGNKVEAAYRRGDLFEKRARLMDAWAKFATTCPGRGSDTAKLRLDAA
jgi:integrase